MTCILRISEAATLAFHAMAVLGRSVEQPRRVFEVAGVLRVSETHLSKVFQRLAKAGLVISRRGPRGGFVLSRPAQQIRLQEIYEAIDGRLSTSVCLLGRSECSFGTCILGDLLTHLNSEVAAQLGKTTLKDLQHIVLDSES